MVRYRIKYRPLRLERQTLENYSAGLTGRMASGIYRTLPEARRRLWDEITDTVNDSDMEPDLRLAMLKVHASRAMPGDRLTWDEVEHWIEEVE